MVIDEVVGTGDWFRLVEAQSKVSVSAVARLAIRSFEVAPGYEPLNVTSKQPGPQVMTEAPVVPCPPKLRMLGEAPVPLTLAKATRLLFPALPAGPEGPDGPGEPGGPEVFAAAERSAGWIVPFAIFAFVTALPAIFAVVTALLAIFAAVTALLASFDALTALFLIFGVVTALLLSCEVPTLLAANWLTAATLVPPSATSSAMEATTNAGDGRWSRRNLRR
jgi:hypothetical protein